MSAAVRGNDRSIQQALEGWKAIASFFDRSVRTIQRWERDENLPVRRHRHRSLSTVFAYAAELERWRLERLPHVLQGAHPGGATDDPAALCALSRDYWAQRTGDALNKSIELAKLALRRRPDYLAARAMLAKAYVTRASLGHLLPRLDLALGHEAAQAVVKDAPDSLDAHQALGLFYLYTYRWSEARAHFQRALALNPDDATTHQWFSMWHLAQRRHDEAFTYCQRAEELAPASLIIAAHAVWVLHLIGRYDEAMQGARALIRRNRHFWRGYFNLGLTLAEIGRPQEALETFDIGIALNPHQKNLRIVRLYLLALAGQRDRARTLLHKQLQSRAYRSAYWSAIAAAALCDDVTAVRELRAAVRNYEWFVLLMDHEPILRHLSQSRQLTAIRGQVGLPPPA